MTLELIALDLDGTTLNPRLEITPAVKASLQRAREQGTHILLASGRPYEGIRPYLEELKLAVPGNYVVSNNGALLHNASDGSVIRKYLLDYDDYCRCMDVAEQLKLRFHVIDLERCYTADRDIGRFTVRQSYLSNIPLRYCPREDMPHNVQFAKFMYADEPDRIEAELPNIPADLYERFTVLRSSSYFLEVFSKETDKGTGVHAVADMLGLAKDKIMCVGDHENDISMIQAAGIGVAMGNALQSVKDIADFVTTDNDHDGVAVAIERYL